MDSLSQTASQGHVPLRLADRFEAIRARDGSVKFVSAGESVRVEVPTEGGAAFTDVLAALVDHLSSGAPSNLLLDGLPPDQQAIAASIVMELRGRGVLEAADPAAVPDPPHPGSAEQRRFFSNFRPVSTYSASPRSDPKHGAAPFAEQSLRAARVAVFGLGRLGAKLVEGLAQVGVGQILAADSGKVAAADLIDSPWSAAELGLVRAEALPRLVRNIGSETNVALVDRGDPFAIADLPAGIDLLVLAEDLFDPEHHRTVNRLCLKSKVPWIGGRIIGTRIEVGPLVIPEATACYRCLELRRLANVAGYAELLDNLANLAAGGRSLGRLNLTLGYEFLVVEIVKILTGFSRPMTMGTLFTFDLLSFEALRHPVLKLPRCPDCGIGMRARPTVNLWNSDAFLADRP